MSRRSDALADVVAAPEDDVPRMAYADLLVAEGDPRGEFIRVQCALANGDVEYLEKTELRERIASLLTAHGAAWMREAGLDPATPVEWRRGFIDTVTLTADEFAGELGDALFAREPVRHAKVKIVSLKLAKLVAGAPHASRLLSLQVLGTLADSALLALLEGPWEALRGLNLGSNVTPYSLPRLLQNDRLASLERLSLTGSDLGGAWSEALADGCALFTLQTLFAAGCALSDEDLAAIAGSSLLAQLTTLCITNNDYGRAGLKAIADSPNSATLRFVEIDGEKDGLEAWVNGQGLQSLARILISGSEWTTGKALASRLRKRFGKGVRWTR